MWDITTIRCMSTAILNIFSMATEVASRTDRASRRLANHDLSWERMEQTNIGIDAMFLHNRLQLSAEYYISKTHDVLTSLEILMTTGNAGGNPFVNAASLQNKGFGDRYLA